MFNKKYCLNFNALNKQKSIRVGEQSLKLNARNSSYKNMLVGVKLEVFFILKSSGRGYCLGFAPFHPYVNSSCRQDGNRAVQGRVPFRVESAASGGKSYLILCFNENFNSSSSYLSLFNSHFTGSGILL